LHEDRAVGLPLDVEADVAVVALGAEISGARQRLLRITAPAQRVPVVRMQQSNRDRVLEELSTIEKKVQADANRRSVLAGLGAGALGAAAGSKFDAGFSNAPGSPVDGAAVKRIVDRERELAATAQQIAEKEAKLKELAQRTAAVEADVARATSRPPVPRRSFAAREKLLKAQKIAEDAVRAAEQDLLARVEAANARAADAERRIVQQQRQADLLASAARIMSVTSAELDTPVIGALAFATAGEAAAIIAANAKISGLQSRAADVTSDAAWRAEQVNREAAERLQRARAEAIEAQEKLRVVRGHADILAQELYFMETDLSAVRSGLSAPRAASPRAALEIRISFLVLPISMLSIVMLTFGFTSSLLALPPAEKLHAIVLSRIHCFLTFPYAPCSTMG